MTQTKNPFDIFVCGTPPVPTDLSDKNYDGLSDEELIERFNTLSLSAAYMTIKGIRPLEYMYDVLFRLTTIPLFASEFIKDDDVIEWGPKEITDLKITVKQLHGILKLIWTYGIVPCKNACGDLERHMLDMRSPLCKRMGTLPTGVCDTITVNRWNYFPKKKSTEQEGDE